MAVIKVTAKEIGRELTERNRGIRRRTQKAMMRSALRGQAMLARRTPKDLGQAKAGWRTSKPVVSNVAAAVDLYNDVPYVGILEHGARPHPVSREGWLAIYQWVRRHFTFSTKIARGKNEGKRSRQKMMDQGDPMLAEITNAIVYKIQKYGQRPTYFVKRSMPELRKSLGREVDMQLGRYSKQRAAKRAPGVKIGDIIE